MRFTCLLVAYFAFASSAAAESARPSASVGMQVLSSVDGARSDRQLQVVIWYPAAAGGAEAALTPKDYLALTLSERGERLPTSEEIDKAAAGFAEMFRAAGASAAAKRWLAAPGAAHRNAPPAVGPFPLVLVAQGNEQSAFDQAPLAEALAIRGFVVATTPSPMRLDGSMQSADEIGQRAQIEAEDLAFAETRVAALFPVDRERLAVVGHSFGARAALLLAMREPRIRALVSLDGGIGTALGREQMERAPWFGAAGTHAAILHYYEELDPFMKPDFALLHAIARGGLELAPTAGMHHHHFTSLGFAAAADPLLAQATGAGPELPASLEALLARLFDFLETNLRDERR